MKKVLITLLVALLAAAFAMVPAFAELNPDDYADDTVFYELDMDNYSVFVDFEGGFVTDDYINSLGDMAISGISFMDGAGFGKIVEGDAALSGSNSFQAKGYMDARIWSLSLLEGEGDYIIVECLFKPICMDGVGGFGLCYNDPEVPTSTNESNGGWLYQVFKNTTTGEIEVKNRAKKVMATLEEGKTYKLACAFSIGTNAYDFFVDGVRVAENNRWIGEVTGLCGFRIDMFGPGWDQQAANAANTVEWAMDDLIITYGNEITKEKYFATPEPTAEPTPEPTEAPVTEAPEATEVPKATDAPKAEDKKGGCGSVVVSSAIVSFMTVAAAVVVLKKKH